MSKFSVAYLYYFKNYYRSKSFYLMLILILLISAIMTYFTFRYQAKLDHFLSTFGVSSVTLGLKERAIEFLWAFVLVDIPVYAAVFFGSPSISSEIEDRTAYYVFSLPINRYTLLSSKYAAAYSVTVIISIIYLMFEIAVFRIIFGVFPDVSLVISFGLLLLFIASIMSLTFFLSSIFNRNIYAYITVLIVYFLVFNAVNVVTDLIYGYTSPFLLNNAAVIVMEVFMNDNLFAFSRSFSIAPAPASEIMLSVLVMIVYVAVSMAIAMILFERKEVK
ncbi:MAG: ABC transporter permease [Thermoplasmata archaeon]